MNQPMPDTLLPNVPENVENEIMQEIAQEFARDVYSEIDDAFPNYILSPSVALPPRERFQKYMQRLVEAYPMDEAARMSELRWLLNTEYIDAYKQGLAPAPLAMPFRVLIHVPKIMKKIQADLRSCYLTWARRAEA